MNFLNISVIHISFVDENEIQVHAFCVNPIDPYLILCNYLIVSSSLIKCHYLYTLYSGCEMIKPIDLTGTIITDMLLGGEFLRPFLTLIFI